MTTLNIVADRNMRGVETCFEGMGSVRLVEGRELGAADLRDADVLLVRSVTRVDPQLLAGTPVRFVGTATSGFDHVDRAFLAGNGIGFSHAPGANANSVVEYVLAAIASIDDKLGQLLGGGPLGIIGYGHIGRALALRCRALGIDCRVYDPWLELAVADSPADLNEVLDSEVIAVHAELTREKPWPSYHLLGAQALERIAPDALLINAGRGEIVDNTALLNLLRENKGPRCVLDVWEGEPAINTALLNCVSLGTAHIAGYSHDGKLQATRMLRDAAMKHFERDLPAGQTPAESAAALEAPPNLYGVQLLRWALAERYDIRRDDMLLRRATSAVTSGEVAAAFDTLRRDYRQRRELAGSVVRACDSRQAELLAALGCRVEHSAIDR